MKTRIPAALREYNAKKKARLPEGWRWLREREVTEKGDQWMDPEGWLNNVAPHFRVNVPYEYLRKLKTKK